MEEEAPLPLSPVPSEKPSQAPSWFMVGFILGALFVLALPPRQPRAPVPPAAPPPAPPVRTVLAPPRMATIEAVFDAWGRYAVWDHDVTEVALWNSDSQGYADCFEVLRAPAGYYFRSIPRLTRPILTHGVKPDAPLQFTETAEQRREWLGEKDEEDWRALRESIRPLPPPARP